MSLIAWWGSLGVAAQIFYCIAIPATLVLLIQTVLMFLGLEDGDASDIGDGVPDVDVSDGVFGDDSVSDMSDLAGLSSLHIFTVRGIIAFFVVFGWVGIVMESFNVNLAITIPVAALCGFAMMVLIAYLFRAVMRLRTDGNFDNRNALGTSGKVYLNIPAARSGEGKVNIVLQGVYVERNAVTDEEEPIPTGSEVVVVGLSGQTNLVVKRK